MSDVHVKTRRNFLLKHIDNKNIIKDRLRNRRDLNARQKQKLSHKRRTIVRRKRERISTRKKKKPTDPPKLLAKNNDHNFNHLEKIVSSANSEHFINDPKSLGYRFFQHFFSQLEHVNLKEGERSVLKQIAIESSNISNVIGGKMESNLKLQFEHSESLLDSTIPAFNPLPPSEWVFLTPDKQRLKNMEELNFTSRYSTSLQPAVLQNSNNAKTIYTVNEKIQRSIGISYLDSEEIPIDLNYLQPECTMVMGENIPEFDEDSNGVNNFLMSTEITIDIGRNKEERERIGATSTQVSRKRQHEDNDEGFNWYEKHMKLLATCKPAKPCTKVSRVSGSLRKSLSFQDETPTSKRQLLPRCRSYNGDSDTSFTESDNNNRSPQSNFFDSMNSSMECCELPRNEQSFSNLSLILDNVNISNIEEIPPPKLYPRKIYD